MGKVVSGGAITQLNRKTGSEPFIVIGINWGAGTSWYSSRAIAGYNANIVEIGTITSSKRQDTMCTSSSVSVTFSDTDGAMKNIIDLRNAEKAPAVVFLAFGGMSTNDFIELLRGKVTGPVSWNEGERTLSLGIESHTESDEIGYSATVDDFSDIMESAEGVPWPMIFGTCAHVPALQIREHTVGHLKFPVKLYKVPSWTHIPSTKIAVLNQDPDVYSLLSDPPVKNKIYVEGGDKFPQNQEIKIEINDVIFRGNMSGELFTVTEGNVSRYGTINFASRSATDNTVETSDDSDNPNVAWVRRIVFGDELIIPSLVNHYVYFKVPGTKYKGTWSNYVVKQVGNKIWFRYPVVNPITKELYNLKSSDRIERCYCIPPNGMRIRAVTDLVERLSDSSYNRASGDGKVGLGYLAWMMDSYEAQQNSWWQCPSEVEVHLWDQEDPDIYIASLIRLTNVKAVFGKRKVLLPDGKSKDIIEQIPTEYYSVQLASNYEVRGQQASAIIFEHPLTSYASQEWSGEIYVTGTSSIGPNAADIIKWVFNSWTNLKPDSSFAHVRSKVNAHEAHFAVFDKRDALRFASEIAFQSRCGLILDSERVGIRFLAEQPVSLNICNEGNTELDSLHRIFTPASEITTRLVTSWTETYREKNRLSEVRQKLISKTEQVIRSLIPSNRRRRTETRYSVYEENVANFGVSTREEPCYIYPNVADVQVFLDFWGHRFANSWQLVSLRTTLMGTILQVFDGITLQYSDATLLNAAILTGQVEEIAINPSDWSVTISVWLPRTSGSNLIDSRAWPES